MQSKSILDGLPQQFQTFLQDEGIDIGNFVELKSRYIRLKPNHNLTLTQLQDIVSKDISIINWIPNMYEIPDTVKISSNPIYMDGLMYGIDLSSAAVVQALDIDENDYKILEICCAPGAKLTYIADLMSQFNGVRKVFGIDISSNRLNIARSLVSKYKLNSIVELVLADGTTYQQETEFDKILVDAECTHEGSIKHLQKYTKQPNQQNHKTKKQIKQSQKQLMQNHTNTYTTLQEKGNDWSQQDFVDRVLDPYKLHNLTKLQYDLLENASTLLRKGGYVVYSTCSFSHKQNEDIIAKFLQIHTNFVTVDPFLGNPLRTSIPCRPGLIEHTIRFDPLTSKCGGMFVAKLKKF